ncbi:prepilin-type N-terminal cleavage/methylation domain-containing protein [Robertmurraya yapensis]|uniref:Prepilin-type N-terminal cleavage/methylation domain-containing protein n=1 Tax=Bacillus yapensis TaxID=2492960 RepID=A0A3S0L577_9BACI|nr:prepilin-type N-terminal cleavage/methylation domain-containing protein [Bacillus yapensis]RTR27321.1 prepilin-type N-terminal cleavage/methylation domain-containing protein [Bacillus yapensis]TKS94041.1 prepilin-type N-terminal cleavage/methylation domain-containing protein [Bacillus yapensis]
MIKNLKKRLKNQRGLTLVELLAVIVILGIVSAIAVPSIGGIIEKSKEDALKADAIQVLNAAKLYASSTTINAPTLLTDDGDKTLEQFLDIKSETDYSITITPEDGAYTYAAITITRDGKTISNVTEENLLSDNVKVKEVKSGS